MELNGLKGNTYIKPVNIFKFMTVTKEEIHGTVETDSKELETATGRGVSGGGKNT